MHVVEVDRGLFSESRSKKSLPVYRELRAHQAAAARAAAPLVRALRRPAELLAVGTWRDAGPLAERVAERGLRRIARQLRGLRERCSLAQQHRRLLHAETGQVAERWLADELREARREDRAREADLLGERGHGPRRLGTMVHGAERRCGT